jgi:nicotinamidase-related amidase
MTDSKTVLLAMDFQHDIVERLADDATIDAASRAIRAAREHGVPVMFVRVAFRPGYPEVAATNVSFGRLPERGDAMTQNHPATQIHAALEPRDDEPVITKRRVSAFSGSDLDVLLRGVAANHLVLAGIATSGVVLSTLRQAADLDYRLTVLSDACRDADPEVHRVLVEKVFPRQALVTTSDEWIESTSSASGSALSAGPASTSARQA